jgi:hypothetical protein
MAELRRIARLTRIIDRENDKLNADIPPGMPDELADSHNIMVSVVDALELFKKRRVLNDLPNGKVNKLYRNAKSEHFIEEKVFRLKTGDNGATELRNCLRVTDGKGRNLIRRRLVLIPVGYWKAFLDDNGQFLKLATIASGIIIAICTVLNLYLSTRS